VPYRVRTRLIRAVEYFVLGTVIIVGMMLLMAVAAGAQTPPKPSPCATVLASLRTVQEAGQHSLEIGKKLKRGSAMRLAVLQAKEIRGYYAAMRALLPLTCHGDEYKALDDELIDEMTKLDIFINKNW
jgi:hypothetical protein